MYVKYNAVLRGLVTGGNRYAATIYLVCSGLRKLSRTTKLPKGLMVYRGNGGMALPFDFLEPDAQVYSLYSLYLLYSRWVHHPLYPLGLLITPAKPLF